MARPASSDRSASKATVPTGRLSRIAGLARAGLGLARGTFSADPIAPLERAADELAQLRGLATKAGQMAGIWSATLPEADRARAEPILARLRARTATSDPDAVVKVIETELGAPLDELFRSFERAPFASASLGQVHRAELLDAPTGAIRAVAVKVQHPGIDVALRADLDNAQRIGGVATLFAVPTAGEMVDDVRARMMAELDYRAEAAWQGRFAALFASDVDLKIPEVVTARSSGRVLTTTLCAGGSVADASRGPHALRQGQAIRRFLTTAWLERGWLFADPHAGNWLFGADGTVTVLDFGSVIEWDEGQRTALAEALSALGRADHAAARRALATLVPDRSPVGTATVETLLVALGPLASDRPVRASSLNELARLGAESKKRMLTSRAKLPRWLPLTLRALIGTMALFVELDAHRP